MRIQDLIYKTGYTFEELQGNTGIPASTLSDIMSGKAVLSHCQARTIQKLAHGLGLTMDELMDMDEKVRAASSVPAPPVGRMHHDADVLESLLGISLIP